LTTSWDGQPSRARRRHGDWECDYPHSDSNWPESPEVLARSMVDVSDEDIDKITIQRDEALQLRPVQRARGKRMHGRALRASVEGHDVAIKSQRRRAIFGSRGRSGRCAGQDGGPQLELGSGLRAHSITDTPVPVLLTCLRVSVVPCGLCRVAARRAQIRGATPGYWSRCRGGVVECCTASASLGTLLDYAAGSSRPARSGPPARRGDPVRIRSAPGRRLDVGKPIQVSEARD